MVKEAPSTNSWHLLYDIQRCLDSLNKEDNFTNEKILEVLVVTVHALLTRETTGEKQV